MNSRHKIRFQYSYVDMGSVAGSDHNQLAVKRNRIFLDVGNGLATGVIDHHHRISGITVGNNIFRSATKLVTIYPEYILKNISPDAEEIEIILHKAPDFDCYAAAFLCEHLIRYGDYPEGYETFADYADMADAGMIRLKKDNYREVYAVACSIEQANMQANMPEQNMTNNPQKQLTHRKVSTRERWFQLFYLVFQWIQEHKGYSLYGSDIFGNESDFQKEIDYAQKDYEIYKDEIRDPKICEKLPLRLPRLDGEPGKLYETEGLFYKGIPKSSLTNLWARIDSVNSHGDGFVFTFLPRLVECPFLPEPEAEQVMTNRVIISTEPNSGFYLKNLAKQLEEAEVIKEEQLFHNHTDHMRCRTMRRPGFEEWCNNDDPWYDGRSFQYTIVDSPRRGSVLSVEEIRQIVLNFTSPRVKSFECNIVLPLIMKGELSNKEQKNPSDIFCYTLTPRIDQNSEYFLDYIERYLHKEKDKTEAGCIRYTLETEPVLLIKDKDGVVRLKPRVEIDKLPAGSYLEIGEIEVLLYRYGVGFIQIKAVLPSGENQVLFPEILQLNHDIRHSYRYLYQYFVHKESLVKLQYSKPLLYSTMIIDSEYFYSLEKKEMLYKLCNCLCWEEPYINSIFLNSLENLCMEMDDDYSYGFSKSGGALLCTPECDRITAMEKYLQKQIGIFQKEYYEIFLFSLHQRLSLLRLENLLSRNDGKKGRESAGKLRKQMMNFVTQGWFSQITENEVGQEVYRRWQTVFECQILYQEVVQQIESVDEYLQAAKSKIYENLSIIVFPLLLIMQILSSGLVKTKTMGPDNGFAWWYTLGFIALLYLATFLIFHKRNR